MGRGSSVKPQLPVDELEERHREERDAVAVRQLQVVWLGAKGLPPTTIVDATGHRRDRVFQFVKRYHDGGPDALDDKRNNNGGPGRLLDDDKVARLAGRSSWPSRCHAPLPLRRGFMRVSTDSG